MNYKVQGAIKRNKKSFIVCAILWLLLVIVFVAPFSYSVFQANVNGKISLDIFINQIATNITNPFATIYGIFEQGATHNFVSLLLGFSIFYLVIYFIGFAKSAPKNEFFDIEHGSSDWSQKGEQYKVLSKHNGILLAEDNYLPLDKRGNVNVLVVGRIWFW